MGRGGGLRGWLHGAPRAWAAPHGRQRIYLNTCTSCAMQVVASRVGDLRGEGGVEGTLRRLLLDGAGTPRRLKTFIVEIAGVADPKSRHPGVMWKIRPSGLDGVSHVTCHDSGRRVPECELLLDRRSGRFCLIHTAEEDDIANAAVSLLARTTQLNRAWVCPGVLGELAGTRRESGSTARGTVRMLSEDGCGHAVADVGCDGTITHVGGESVGAHLLTARSVCRTFARMCSNAERYRIGSFNTPNGPNIDLMPIDVTLSRTIEDVPGFIDRVFDGHPPLHMRGGKIRVSEDQYHVPTVDMEGAIHMGLDVTPSILHVGLRHGCSGSGVLRLLACLQLRHDPTLTCDQVTSGACRA